MPDARQFSAKAPLDPFYAPNDVGQSILLHEGPISGATEQEQPGRIELACSPTISLDWQISPGPNDFASTPDRPTLLLRRPYGEERISAWTREYVEGWTNGAALGDENAPLVRIVAHWFNLPRFLGQEHLSQRIDGVERFWANGRWHHEVDGWKIVIDARSDHEAIWEDLLKRRLYAMTHVMEISRSDGSLFSAAEAAYVLRALQYGFSFSLGRWVAPLLPIGFGSDGEVVWEEWRRPHCDPARKLSSGWWLPEKPTALTKFLDGLVPAFADADQAESLRLQMGYAITAIRDQGFTEQRIMIGAAGLEHSTWQRLRLSGLLTNGPFKSLHAGGRLRRILQDVNISTEIDADLHAALAQFAEAERIRGGTPIDAPEALTRIRNRLVHPQGAQEHMYQIDGLMTEAWLLIRHFLSLLILESVGYRGPLQNLARIRGWSGESEETPWS